MNKLRLCLGFLEEHRTLFKTAMVIIIMISAVLFCTLNGEEGEISDNLLIQSDTLGGGSAAGTVTDDGEDDSKEPEAAQLYVDIGGAVKNPGVYTVDDGSRVFEVIEMAGGLTEDALTTQINQAEILTDGQKIWIPSKEDGDSGLASGSGKNAEGKININIADSVTLQELPGVGPATAEKIIAYRTENGRFASPEDLKKVSGIGEKTFEKLRDKITV